MLSGRLALVLALLAGCGGAARPAAEPKAAEEAAPPPPPRLSVAMSAARSEPVNTNLDDYLPILNRATGKPDPAATYRVPVARSPVDGAPDALVTMVVASEVGDLYVGRLMPIIGQLQATYGNDLRIVWKSFIVRPLESQAAALGLCAAGRQGLYAAYLREAYDRIFVPSPGKVDHRAVNAETAGDVARTIGADADVWMRDFYSFDCRDQVIADQQLMSSLGVTAAPVTFINGRYQLGAKTLADYTTLIDETLRTARAAVSSNPSQAASYYTRLMATARTTP